MTCSKDDINNNLPPQVKLDDDKETIDPLLKHISSAGLPLKFRPPTLSDGNCWYDAMADQVKNNLF